MLSIISSGFLRFKSVRALGRGSITNRQCSGRGIARKICRREIDISVNLHSYLLYLVFT